MTNYNDLVIFTQQLFTFKTISEELWKVYDGMIEFT